MHAFHYEGSAKDQRMQDVLDSDPDSVTVSKQQHSYRNSQDNKNSCSTHTGYITDNDLLCDFAKHTLPESTLGLPHPTSLTRKLYSKPKSTYMARARLKYTSCFPNR